MKKSHFDLEPYFESTSTCIWKQNSIFSYQFIHLFDHWPCSRMISWCEKILAMTLNMKSSFCNLHIHRRTTGSRIDVGAGWNGAHARWFGIRTCIVKRGWFFFLPHDTKIIVIVTPIKYAKVYAGDARYSSICRFFNVTQCVRRMYVVFIHIWIHKMH